MKNDENDNTDNPIEELEKILEGAGADVAKLFGPALTIFAGQAAVHWIDGDYCYLFQRAEYVRFHRSVRF